MEKRKIVISDEQNLNGVNIELPLSDSYAENLNQNELLNNEYLDEVKEKNINKIINYEKCVFYPAYLRKSIAADPDTGDFLTKDDLISIVDESVPKLRPGEEDDGREYYDENADHIDDYVCDVNKINFNLYLKHRECDEYNDYGSWDTSDEFYWNRWDGTKNGNNKVMNNELSTTSNGDLLGCLGFTDEDIFYQKNNLKKSFLRISVYDTPYRQTQKLLYYSTLFFDSNILYKKYINLNKYPRVNNGEMRVYQSNYLEGSTVKSVPDEEKLTATFTCTSKNDSSACSDGFYLYLFNTVIKSGKCAELYMKVEFNHAKYGKTVVLTNPRNKIDRNVQISLENNSFPLDYEVKAEGSSNSYVDINKLYNDMYIPIIVRYNNKKNRYEWYIESNEHITSNKETGEIVVAQNADIININLYEPRINKLKPIENG